MTSRPVVRIFLMIIENAEDLDGPIVAPSVDSGERRGCMDMEGHWDVALQGPAHPVLDAVALESSRAINALAWP
jgi:hypothetical protein